MSICKGQCIIMLYHSLCWPNIQGATLLLAQYTGATKAEDTGGNAAHYNLCWSNIQGATSLLAQYTGGNFFAGPIYRGQQRQKIQGTIKTSDPTIMLYIRQYLYNTLCLANNCLPNIKGAPKNTQGHYYFYYSVVH